MTRLSDFPEGWASQSAWERVTAMELLWKNPARLSMEAISWSVTPQAASTALSLQVRGRATAGTGLGGEAAS
ncbi:MAG: hypothetical protein ACK5XN_04230 [Bacteroidota bacterium]